MQFLLLPRMLQVLPISVSLILSDGENTERHWTAVGADTQGHAVNSYRETRASSYRPTGGISVAIRHFSERIHWTNPTSFPCWVIHGIMTSTRELHECAGRGLTTSRLNILYSFPLNIITVCWKAIQNLIREEIRRELKLLLPFGP
jgi:hypothetical protein